MRPHLLAPEDFEGSRSMSDNAPPSRFDEDPAPETRIVGTVENPFQRARSAHLSEGAVEIGSAYAVAEAQGKLILAKRFPRDEGVAFDKLMDACSRTGLAGVAIYQYKRGGQAVSGPSIRLAEELLRCWGNCESGLRELSRKPGESEMEAFAWDYETNNLSTQRFTVKHIRDKSEGNVSLSSERDIYEITANMGQRRVRARILAVLPSDLVEAAVHQCKKTLAGGNKIPLADRIKAMILRFKDAGVTTDQLAAYLGHALDETTPDEIVTLTGVFNSIKDGDSRPADWFGAKGATGGDRPASRLDALEQSATTKPETVTADDKQAAWVAAHVRLIAAMTTHDRLSAHRQAPDFRGSYDALRQDRPELAKRLDDAFAAATVRIGPPDDGGGQ